MNAILEEINRDISRITKVPLYARQMDALKELSHLLNNHGIKGIIRMPTGSGKTRLITAFLLLLKKTKNIDEGDIILFLTPRQVIRNQVVEELKILEEFEFMIREIPNSDNGTKEFKNTLIPLNEYIKIIIITPQLFHSTIMKYFNGCNVTLRISLRMLKP